MIRINLLPHRAEKRRRRLVQFYALCGVSAALAAVLVGLGYGVMTARIAYQDSRNQFLNREIAKLEKQIAELKKLQKEIKQEEARKDVVEDLQSSRSDVVHLFDQMLHIVPKGIYLTSLTQKTGPKGSLISIHGVAQTDGNVSTFMRAIDGSPWLDSPVLEEVQSSGTGKDKKNTFSMQFNLKKGAQVKAAAASAVTATGPGGATAAKPSGHKGKKG